MIFTEPQVAAVGHTLAVGAGTRGSTSGVVEAETSGNAGGSFYGRNARGHVAAAWSTSERGVVVGATITGSEVADFLHAATIASSARCRSTAWPTRSRRFPPAARSGSA